MITRSNLAEQLREYQTRSKHEWATASFFSSTSSHASSRVDAVFVIWEMLMFALLVLAGVALYLRYMKLAFLLICVTALVLVCMKVTKQIRQNRKSKRKMLLPLSM
ncbi:hypothetical protein OPV22_021236 [Ensete ventricosum]|uniref:Uncharacterized protein n=1 Tax=Ensete ventricosum TaxID=4639 RepID=A0AAV8QLI5_ENSVE|nr:hypothetical protein OPV22_021236 [Ensete ventricosum]